jgi:NAD(P)H-flavin reductase
MPTCARAAARQPHASQPGRLQVSLVFANVSEGDIILKDRIDDLAAKHKNFHVRFCETTTTTPSGSRGRRVPLGVPRRQLCLRTHHPDTAWLQPPALARCAPAGAFSGGPGLPPSTQP